MEITKDIYANTDKIIVGEEYRILYNGKIYSEDKDNILPKYTVCIRINENEYSMKRKEYGFVANCVFDKYENNVSIYKKCSDPSDDKKDNKNKKDNNNYSVSNYNIEAIEKPDILKEKEITNYIYVIANESISKKITDAITKAIKMIPKIFENRLDIAKLKGND